MVGRDIPAGDSLVSRVGARKEVGYLIYAQVHRLQIERYQVRSIDKTQTRRAEKKNRTQNTLQGTDRQAPEFLALIERTYAYHIGYC
jgi:hypothetical protein